MAIVFHSDNRGEIPQHNTCSRQESSECIYKIKKLFSLCHRRQDRQTMESTVVSQTVVSQTGISKVSSISHTGVSKVSSISQTSIWVCSVCSNRCSNRCSSQGKRSRHNVNWSGVIVHRSKSSVFTSSGSIKSSFESSLGSGDLLNIGEIFSGALNSCEYGSSGLNSGEDRSSGLDTVVDGGWCL